VHTEYKLLSPAHNTQVSCPFPIHGQDHSEKEKKKNATLWSVYYNYTEKPGTICGSAALTI